ncbi:MAG: hypothetical protein KDK91_15435 [Gammaproteobacteria bacterium]|nr:hypothetical protein [Gammaproteobacteria bacterium]
MDIRRGLAVSATQAGGVEPAPTFSDDGRLTNPQYWDWVARHDPRYHPDSIVLDVQGRKLRFKTPLEVWGASTLVLEGVADAVRTQAELNRHMRDERVRLVEHGGEMKASIRIIATHYAGGTLGPVRTLHSAIVLEPRDQREAFTIMYWRYYSDSIYNYLFKDQIWGVTNTWLPVGGVEHFFGDPSRKMARVAVMTGRGEQFGASDYLTNTPARERDEHRGAGLELCWDPGRILDVRPYEMTDGAYVSKANVNQNVRYSHHQGLQLVGEEGDMAFDPARGDRLVTHGAYQRELERVGFESLRWHFYPHYDGSVYIYRRYGG